MELGAESWKDDEGARASPSSSPSCEGAAADDDNKDLPKQQQRATGGSSSGGGDDDDEGTRQPYKCTFCKRGFPTAQALGGHMNVHRRHRSRPAAAAAGAAAGSTSAASFYDYDQPCSTTTTATPVLAFAAVTRPAAPAALLHAQRKPQHELPLFGCAAGRGSRSGTAAGDGVREDDRGYYLAKDDGDGGDQELDLELRLGGGGS